MLVTGPPAAPRERRRPSRARTARAIAAGLAALKAGKQIHYEGVGGPIHFNAFHNSPGNFSASGFDASGNPTLLGVIPGTQVQQLLS